MLNRTLRVTALTAAALLVPASGAYAQTQTSAPAPAAASACTASEFSLGTDAENGAFDGMNHGGTLVVLRNVSSTACTLSPFLKLTMRDAHGKPLTIALDNTPGFPHAIYHGAMGHGPIVFPLAVAPGAEATTSLRWTSGEVYDHSVCIDVASIDVGVGEGAVHAPLHAHICGKDAADVEVTAGRLALDPRSPQLP